MIFTVKELRKFDLDCYIVEGIRETLRSLWQLKTSFDIRIILKELLNNENEFYKIFIALHQEGFVMGITTLLVEQKVIHNGGKVGHIEDVAVEEKYKNCGVGSALIREAVARAKESGCYKVILNCSKENVGFYQKLGFKEHDIGMRIDLL